MTEKLTALLSQKTASAVCANSKNSSAALGGATACRLFKEELDNHSS